MWERPLLKALSAHFLGFVDTFFLVNDPIKSSIVPNRVAPLHQFKYHHNQELVGILGNFVHRVLVLVHKYLQGRVPSPHSFTAIDQHIIATVKKIPLQIGDAIEAFKFKKRLALIIDMARAGNKYLTDTAPWHTIKNDKQQAVNTLYICLQIIAKLACYMSPYLPFTSQKLASILPINVNAWHDNQPFEHIPPGTPINAPQLLFTKLT